MIQPLCDMLWLYANTQTYFTPNEHYTKCKGEKLGIRRCDIRSEGGKDVLLC